MEIKNITSRTLKFTVTAQENNYKAGDFLRLKGISRRLIVKLKKHPEGILCNGVHIRTPDRVYEGDRVDVIMTDIKCPDPNYELSVPVIYEDEDIVVFDKPVGMPVHPSANHQGDTLGNYFAALNRGLTFRPLNRLDRDTSGLCAVAKNAYAANILQKTLDKTYYAAVCGSLAGKGRIDAPIARKDKSIIMREVREDGRYAVTDYTVIKNNLKYSLVRVKLATGRTHQIRVHFAHIGHPVAGDDMYGGDCSDINCQALHCKELEFKHPVTKEHIRLTSELRSDIKYIFSDNTP